MTDRRALAEALRRATLPTEPVLKKLPYIDEIRRLFLTVPVDPEVFSFDKKKPSQPGKAPHVLRPGAAPAGPEIWADVNSRLGLPDSGKGPVRGTVQKEYVPTSYTDYGGDWRDTDELGGGN
jgi:hypothetical protein